MSNLKLESINNSSYGKRMVENDYMRYFNKNIHAKPIAYMSSPVADNLDFAETSTLQMFERQNHKIKYAVNSRFSTVRHIRENERNLLFISEALFKTYPTKKLIDAVDKLVKSDPGTTPITVTYGQIGTIVDTNDEFYDSPVYDVTIDKPNLEISPLTRFTIPVFSSCREDFLRNFTKQIRAVGYEINDIVTYDVKTQPFHDKQIRILEIIVEARYNDMPCEMIHYCNSFSDELRAHVMKSCNDPDYKYDSHNDPTFQEKMSQANDNGLHVTKTVQPGDEYRACIKMKNVMGEDEEFRDTIVRQGPGHICVINKRTGRGFYADFD